MIGASDATDTGGALYFSLNLSTLHQKTVKPGRATSGGKSTDVPEFEANAAFHSPSKRAKRAVFNEFFHR